MENKDLKKLSRRELVDIIYQLKKNEEKLQAEMASLTQEVLEKRVKMSEAGSIAEATVSLTNIFGVAQQTADIYLKEICTMKHDAKNECEKMIADAKAQVESTYAEGKKKLDVLAGQYQDDYAKWQKLRDEIRSLEKVKNQLSQEA